MHSPHGRCAVHQVVLFDASASNVRGIDVNQEDRQFMVRFGTIIAGLVLFAVLIAVLAHHVHQTLVADDNPSREANKLARIAPTTAVYTGAADLASAPAKVAPAAPEAPFHGTLDGAVIYQNVCSACHALGAAGAPKLEAGDWTERRTKGIDALYASALDGLNLMPAKGGRMDLTAAQVRAAVDWMLAQIQ